MTLRVMTNLPAPSDATSWYRASGPLNEIRDIDVEFIPCPRTIEWDCLTGMDVLFSQRPYGAHQLAIMKRAKSYNLVNWVDFDDDLLTVPTYNPTHETFGREEVMANVQEAIKMADIITVSTMDLGASIRKINPKVLVVPNAINTRLYHRVSDTVQRNQTVCYRGSSTHDVDVRIHADIILEAYEKFPQYSWCFVGWNPHFITDAMSKDRMRHVHWISDPLVYMANLQKLRPAIGIVPLCDNQFNRSKSRIAHLELSLAGAMCVTPDWQEWQGSNTFKYSNPASFREQLFSALETPIERLGEMNNADWQWIKEHRSLDKVNVLRKEMLLAIKAKLSRANAL